MHATPQKVRTYKSVNGQQFKRKREQLGETQMQFGRRFGLRPDAVSKIERGLRTQLRSHIADKINAFLGEPTLEEQLTPERAHYFLMKGYVEGREDDPEVQAVCAILNELRDRQQLTDSLNGIIAQVREEIAQAASGEA